MALKTLGGNIFIGQFNLEHQQMYKHKRVYWCTQKCVFVFLLQVHLYRKILAV